MESKRNTEQSFCPPSETTQARLYPPSQKTAGVSPRLNASQSSASADFAPPSIRKGYRGREPAELYNPIRGFTLLELLVVISILALLATTTILVINPAELLKRARDSERISDLSVMQSAIHFYLGTTKTIDLDGSTGNCANEWFTHKSGTANPFQGPTTMAATTSRTIDGTGWIPIDFSLSSAGTPLTILPIDPQSDGTTYYYAYGCDNSSSTYELNANFESEGYSCGGNTDAESSDGGDRPPGGAGCTEPTRYEVGTEPGLDM